MSADNGIYIGRFLSSKVCQSCLEIHPKESMCPPHEVRVTGQAWKNRTDIFEYRVIHAQAIENCDYDPKYPNELTDAYRVDYYGKADVCSTEQEAWEQAHTMEKEIAESDFPILEYGVSMISYDVPFPTMTVNGKLVNIPSYQVKVGDVIQVGAARKGQAREIEQKTEQEKQVVVKCLVTKGMLDHEYFIMVQDYPR